MKNNDFELIKFTSKLRRPGENLFDTLERLLVYEAMHKSNFLQRRAAKLLGISSRVMCYKCQNYGINYKNRIKKDEPINT